jgi:hypothetical protein
MGLAKSGLIRKVLKGEGQRFSVNFARPHLVRALQRFRATLYSCWQLGSKDRAFGTDLC